MLEMEAPGATPAEVPPPAVETAAPPPASAPPLRDAEEDETRVDRSIESKEKDATKSSLQNVTVGGSLRIRGDYKEPQADAQPAPAPAEEPAPPQPPAMMAAPVAAPAAESKAEGVATDATPYPLQSAPADLDHAGSLDDLAAQKRDTTADTPLHASRTPESVGRAAKSAHYESTEHRTVAGREFAFKDGAWRESGYDGASVRELRRDSWMFKLLVEKHPLIVELGKLDGKVIFRLEDSWYALLPPD